MNNSSGYLNAILFLGYLFVAIFIMLSMFLAILAEAQVAVREDESTKNEDPEYNEYGVLAYSADVLKHHVVEPLKAKLGIVDEEDEDKGERNEHMHGVSNHVVLDAVHALSQSVEARFDALKAEMEQMQVSQPAPIV
eukprot:2027560-Prymnesium_polylepis.1